MLCAVRAPHRFSLQETAEISTETETEEEEEEAAVMSGSDNRRAEVQEERMHARCMTSHSADRLGGWRSSGGWVGVLGVIV